MNPKHSGTVWLFNPNPQSTVDWPYSGLRLTKDLSVVQSNDCVIPLGSAASYVVQFEAYERLRLNTGLARPWLMNRLACQVGQWTSDELERRLRREGLPVRRGGEAAEGGAISVAIWGLDAVEIRRRPAFQTKFNEVNNRRLADIPAYGGDHALWKPAERLAVRALYSSGLDFGQVELSVSEQGKLAVIGLSPQLLITGKEGQQRLAATLAQFALDWKAETSNRASARLGADPEFLLLTPQGRVASASKYFPRNGETGCDSVRVRGEKRWPIVELRPRPSPEPLDILAHLRKLLLVAADRTRGHSFTWKAGALPVAGLPLGGHVHLSGLPLSGERLRALDQAVGLTLRLLEPDEAARRRPRYGALGDFRRQPHGGFEYRTPPSWLISPRLALGVLAMAKVAAEHARELASCRPLDEDSFREAFYQGDRPRLLEAARSVYEAIRQTEGYRNYREAIQFLYQAIARQRRWDEAADIRLKWKIPLG
jgi:hypothetical protein